MAALERIYSISFENVTVSALQDFFAVKASATNGVAVRRISLSAGGVTVPAEIRVRLKRMPATYTIGSAGSAPTIQKVNSLLPFASLSTNARANDTTQSTTSGTAQILMNWQWNVLQDFLDVGPTDDERWECTASEGLVVDCAAAPPSTIMSGTFVFEET
jgi:hypothetical protein